MLLGPALPLDEVQEALLAAAPHTLEGLLDLPEVLVDPSALVLRVLPLLRLLRCRAASAALLRVAGFGGEYVELLASVVHCAKAAMRSSLRREARAMEQTRRHHAGQKKTRKSLGIASRIFG